MRIILTQNVPNLGSLGDEVAVKGGYARNFLLPRGMAIAAGAKNAKALEHRRHFLEKQRADAIAAAQSEADRVRAIDIVVKVRAGSGGRLFGSVTNRDLQALFAEQGFEVDRKAIVLRAPVKTLGTFEATMRLHTDVKVDFEFRVEASEIVATPEADAEGAGEGEGPAAEAAAADAPEGEAAPAAAAEADPQAAPAEEPTNA